MLSAEALQERGFSVLAFALRFPQPCVRTQRHPSRRHLRVPGAPYIAARNANVKNSKPPVAATALWLMRFAIRLPPTTASPVQKQCPRIAPTVTPNGFICDASCEAGGEARARV